MMEKRVYKDSGEEISLLGFGCMRLPRRQENSPEIDVKTARAMIDYALEHGVNYFDTAHPYHEGLSEPFVGEALSGYPRDKFNLATKMPTWLIGDQSQVHDIFAGQLQKCRVEYVEYFDYYLVHNIGGTTFPKVEECRIYEILKAKKREGRIRRLGFSFHAAPELLRKVVSLYEWDFAQIQLNYLDWELQDAKSQYEILTEKGIPVVVMEPVRGGALAKLCPQAIAVFRAAEPKASAASWALRYAASLPNVLTVLSGMSAMEQIKDNVATMEDFRPLTREGYATIADALAAYRLSGTIPCTACGYCMDCPFGVNIPKVFAIYNNYRTNNLDMLFTLEYEVLGKSGQAANCKKCGRCLPLCPQAIKIAEWMEKIDQAALKAAALPQH
ncbi:MAG: aldo/keto reductase [Acidaminococcales bacterium]|jgi:predicted aldo/keto reductase-like oxidoreductase|nr:aldo/keto reductase [Acidaminococcales bacterium]